MDKYRCAQVEQGIVEAKGPDNTILPGAKTTLTATSAGGLPQGRSVQEVLAILYSGTQPGGFYPNGVNGVFGPVREPAALATRSGYTSGTRVADDGRDYVSGVHRHSGTQRDGLPESKARSTCTEEQSCCCHEHRALSRAQAVCQQGRKHRRRDDADMQSKRLRHKARGGPVACGPVACDSPALQDSRLCTDTFACNTRTHLRLATSVCCEAWHSTSMARYTVVCNRVRMQPDSANTYRRVLGVLRDDALSASMPRQSPSAAT